MTVRLPANPISCDLLLAPQSPNLGSVARDLPCGQASVSAGTWLASSRVARLDVLADPDSLSDRKFRRAALSVIYRKQNYEVGWTRSLHKWPTSLPSAASGVEAWPRGDTL